MASTVSLTGSVLLPDGSAPTDGQLRFALTATDTDQTGREAFPAGGVKVITLDDGVIPAGTAVWRNTAGLRGTAYQIYMLWTDADGRRQQKNLGTRTVGDAASYTLAGLLDADPPEVQTSYSLSITADEYAEVMAVRQDAAASAESAGVSATAATAAATTATDAATTATDAAGTATDAAGTATTAATTATDAAGTATTAATTATNAATTATTAATTATTAATTATDAAGTATTAAANAQASALTCATWAEGTLPGGAGTKSAREWSVEAEQARDAAVAAAEFRAPSMSNFLSRSDVTLIGSRWRADTGEVLDVVAAGTGDYNHPVSGSGVRTVGQWRLASAFSTATAVANYIYSAATNARLLLTGSVLAMTQTLYLSGRMRDGEMTTSAAEGIRAYAGATMDRLKITAAGAVDIGVHVQGDFKARDLTVDMTASTGSGRHALATTTTAADVVDVLGYTANAPGYGFLPNETAPPSQLILTHFDIKAGADAIELNYPGVAGENHVISGGLLHAGEGGSGSASGFPLGIAHVHGFVASNFLSKYSRREGVHIEDGSKFGVLGNYVLKDCKWHGFVGGPGGAGDHQAESTPMVNSGWSYEYTGAPGNGATAIYNVWDAKGSADFWLHSSGYAKGFDNGVNVYGSNSVCIADDVIFDAVPTVISAAGKARHYGSIYARGATAIVKSVSDGDRIHIDAVFAPKDKPTSGRIFDYPTTRNMARGTIRQFELKAVGVDTICAAAGYTNVTLIALPRKFIGDIIVRANIGTVYPVSIYSRVKWTGSALTTGDSVADTDNDCSLTGLTASGGNMLLSVYNAAAFTRTVNSMTIEFDGLWIE